MNIEVLSGKPKRESAGQSEPKARKGQGQRLGGEINSHETSTSHVDEKIVRHSVETRRGKIKSLPSTDEPIGTSIRRSWGRGGRDVFLEQSNQSDETWKLRSEVPQGMDGHLATHPSNWVMTTGVLSGEAKAKAMPTRTEGRGIGQGQRLGGEINSHETPASHVDEKIVRHSVETRRDRIKSLSTTDAQTFKNSSTQPVSHRKWQIVRPKAYVN